MIALATVFAATSLAGPAIACKWTAVKGTVFEKLAELREEAMRADDSADAKWKAVERTKQLQVEAMGGDAFALLRAGFWTTTMREVKVINDVSGPDMLAKAAALKPNEAEYQFFAALGYIHHDKARFTQYWKKAQALAKPGSATEKNMKIVAGLYPDLVD
jgi:hypothetical protein